MNRSKGFDERQSNSSSFNTSREANCFGKRHILMLLGFIGFANVYALRVNLSVALVAMVNSTYANVNPEGKSHDCISDTSTSEKNEDGTFKWDQHTQGIILGSFFYGYVFTQMPGGWIGAKYGAKRVFGFAVFVTSVLTLLTPLAANFSVYALIALRILEGLAEGVTFPAMHAMWSYWAPPLERTKLVTVTYVGAEFGTIMAYPLSGWLCANGFAGGWPSVFYVFGTLGFLWVIAWMYFVHDTPRDHPTISKEELEYIETTIDQEQDHLTPKNQGYKTPWKALMTSFPVWSIIVCFLCYYWSYYTLLTNMPTYFKDILGVNIRENGFISAIPYICNFLSCVAFGNISDYVRRRGLCSTEVVRKVATTAGLILAASSLIGASFVQCHQTSLAVFFLSFALIGGGCVQSGFPSNHLDIGARYGGVLMAITNMAATISGFVAPYVVGLLTNKKPTRHQWQIVFFIAASMNVFGMIFFLFFGSGTEQKWNRPENCCDSLNVNSEEDAFCNPRSSLITESDNDHFSNKIVKSYM